MTQTKQATPSTGPTKTPSSDALVNCINSMIDAMKADFGHKFKSQFGHAEELRLYKRRLYQMLRGRDIKHITDAYNGYALSGKEWPPTVPELISALDDVEKTARRKQAEEMNHLLKLSAPAKKIVECNPLEMLANAKVKTGDDRTPEQMEQDKKDAWQRHKALVAPFSVRNIDADHLCAYPSCNKAGSISDSIRGGGTWYCKEHFKK